MGARRRPGFRPVWVPSGRFKTSVFLNFAAARGYPTVFRKILSVGGLTLPAAFSALSGIF